MRIISGKYKGRNFTAKLPKGIRPTQDAMRETIFNILNNYIEFENLVVADICAGAGMLGLEALSRGAEIVFFVDKSHKSQEYIKNSLLMIKPTENTYKLFNLDATQFIGHYYEYLKQNTGKKINLLFLDPPYKTNIVNEVIAVLESNNILDDNAIIVAETDIHYSIYTADQYQILTERQFGASKITLLKKNLHS